MKTLFILNDPPYGTERCYNALRLAQALSKNDPRAEVTVFLVADSVVAARKKQKTPDGYYNLEQMLNRVLIKGRVLLCATCIDARGIAEDAIIEGACRSSMDDLAAATMAADKVLIF